MLYQEVRNKLFLEESIQFLKKVATDSLVSYKHAAALISNNIIYSFGKNKFLKEIKINNISYYKTMHAEINVFEKLPKTKKFHGMDILVIRINKNHVLKNSRPCNQCIEKLLKLGIRKVYYSTDDGTIVCEFLQNMEKKHISSGNKNLCNHS